MTYAYVFANNYKAEYSETYMNWSCSKAETLLRDTDTSGPVCFLYALLPRISKANTVCLLHGHK